MGPPAGCVRHPLITAAKAAELQEKVSNGALVATIGCDDEDKAGQLAEHVLAFKVGVKKPRSRGDRDEPFGAAARRGRVHSWVASYWCTP